MIGNEGAHCLIRTPTKFYLTWSALGKWLVYAPHLEVTLEARACRPLCNSPFPSVSRETYLTFYIGRILLEFQILKVRTSPLK